MTGKRSSCLFRPFESGAAHDWCCGRLRRFYFFSFISHVRKQMMAYKERTLKAMHEAGKAPSEIAAELSFGNHIVTEKTVERMIERLFG